MAYKTIKCVFVPNLNSLGPTETELENLENFLFCYMGKWAGVVLLPTNMAAATKFVEIFKTLNSRNFCMYWCIDLKLAEIL